MRERDKAPVGWAPCRLAGSSLEGTKRVHALPGPTDRDLEGKIHPEALAGESSQDVSGLCTCCTDGGYEVACEPWTGAERFESSATGSLSSLMHETRGIC